MEMQINYPIAILIVVAAIIFVILLIRRNQKDEKNFERDVTKSEIKPEEYRKEK